MGSRSKIFKDSDALVAHVACEAQVMVSEAFRAAQRAQMVT